MSPAARGLVVAVVQVALVASLGAKLLYDRATRPRVWALTAPVDPELPIRGRYVQLRVVVEPRGLAPPGEGAPRAAPVTLHAEAGRLIAEPVAGEATDFLSPQVLFIERAGETVAVLEEPVAFFIPETVADPSARMPGEELWVETTIPKQGPPRPIRLGIRKDGGEIVPWDGT